jgi:hypothetical protein
VVLEEGGGAANRVSKLEGILYTNGTLFLVYLHRIRRNISLKQLIMPRTRKASGKARHDPLLVQLDEDELETKYGRVSQPGKRQKSKHSNLDNQESGEV